MQFAQLKEHEVALGLLRILIHPAVIAAGLHYSIPLLTILLAHEFGHYFACRHHRLDATLPFFIPVPFGLGTFGAFIKIRTPIATKKELIDVGAAGPIAGFVATIPFLFVGISQSQIAPILPTSGAVRMGEPLAFKIVSQLLFPHLAEGQDLWVGPMAYAAWFGLLVTALNLIPLGQLDGGHIIYALLGRRQKSIVWPILVAMFIFGFYYWVGWLVWLVLIKTVIGTKHPPLLNEEEPLNTGRELIGWVCILIFIVCFTPQPFDEGSFSSVIREIRNLF